MGGRARQGLTLRLRQVMHLSLALLRSAALLASQQSRFPSRPSGIREGRTRKGLTRALERA